MKQKIYFLSTLGLGALGFAIQCWAQSTGFDPDTGLVLPSAASILTLKLFFAAAAIITLLLALALRGAQKTVSGDGLLYQQMGFKGRCTGILAGMLLCGSALLRLSADLSTLQTSVLDGSSAFLADVLLLAAGAGLVWQIFSGKTGRSLFVLLPGFACAFWLAIYYHSQSSDPVVERYGTLLLCLMAAALAFYHQAGYFFGSPGPVRSMWFSMLAGIFALIALPASQTVADALALTGLALWMLLHTVLLAAAPAPAPEQPVSDAPEAGQQTA